MTSTTGYGRVVQDAINGVVKNSPNDTYGAPSAVMRSVSTPANSSTMDLYWVLDASMDNTDDLKAKYNVVLYFAEDEFRQFDVLLDNNVIVAQGFRPQQMVTTVLTRTVQGSTSHIPFVAAPNSKPPLISAMEIFLVRPCNKTVK
ncbi:hypothetical protein U9M48_003135 [Paspalum notatum var. saurae]|uniref:Malectin-like domain-containing protein n=1 Tax=Paspalum notatum var. saurae TaxID=547442 RepID=A0AAQ3PKL4_PASNO